MRTTRLEKPTLADLGYPVAAGVLRTIQDRDKCWYPLDDLRRGVQAKAERTLLNQIWADIEKTLGWRPVFPSGKGRGKQ
ncbi:MAG: hypothetical protein WCY08_06855 [Rhodocyclaceae bacterium]